MRLIDADNLYNTKFQNTSGYGLYVAYKLGWNDAIDTICENEPSIEPKRGEWIHPYHYGLALPEHQCSVCGEWENSDTESNFCPYCGARMKGADDE